MVESRSLKFLMSLFLVLLSCSAAVADNNKVMVIHSYSADLLWVKEINQGIEKVLASKYALSYHYMNTKVIPESEFAGAAKAAFAVFEEVKPAAVIICDDNGLRLVGQSIANQVPVIFCGINGQLRVDHPWVADTPNITGVLERPLIKRTMLEMKHATGISVRKALVLLGMSPTAQAFFTTDLFGKAEFEVQEGFSVNVRRLEGFEDWQSAVLGSKSKGYDFVLAAGYGSLRDKEGNHISFENVSKWISSNTPVPVFTVHSQGVGEGKLVGGMVVSGEYMGEDAAMLLQQVLAQSAPASKISIKFQNVGKLLFSEKELARWSLQLNPKYLKQSTLLP